MSNFGQGITAVAGGVIGFFIGGPTGAAYGFQLGLLAGSALFPTQLPSVSGPRLEDLTTTNAEIGGPIVIPWGSPPVAGTVMHLGELREVETTDKQGGKGAPEQSVTTYTYFQNIAIGLAEHRPGIRLAAAWENGAVVYDIRPKREDESGDDYTQRQNASAAYAETFVFHDGNEDQMPDPTIEMDKGAGNVPAHRGIAYIVFPDRQLKDDQGRHHPNFRFLLTTDNEAVVEVTEYASAVKYPWAFDGTESTRNIHEYQTGTQDANGFNINDRPDSLSEMLSIIATRKEKAFGAILITKPPGSVFEDTFYRIYTEYAFSATLDEWNAALAGGNTFETYSLNPAAPLFLGYGISIVKIGPFEGGNPPQGIWVCEVVDGAGMPPSSAPTSDYFRNGGNEEDGFTTAHFWETVDVTTRRMARAPDNPCLPRGLPPEEFISANFCELDDGTIAESKDWIEATPFYTALQIDGNNRFPLGPVIPGFNADTDPNFLNEDFWTAAYIEAVASGLMEGGMTYHPPNETPFPPEGNFYPYNTGPQGGIETECYQITRKRTVQTASAVSLATIVADVCARVGLDDIDVEDLRLTNVGFYASTRVSSARSVLEPLRPIGLFDVVESGTTLKFVTRGKPIVAALTEEDIGAHEAGTDRPPLVTTKKAQDVELPRLVRVHYLAESRDYEKGEQKSRVRIETDAVQDVDVEIVAGITDDQAKQIAEITQNDAWASRWSHEFSTDQTRSELECADAVTVPIDQRIQRVRIVSIDESIPMLRKIAAVRDDADSYVSTAVAPVVERRPNVPTVLKASDLLLLDLPPLRDEDDDAGVYAAAIASGAGNRWQGAAIRRSVDGTTFTQILTITSEARVGAVVTGLPAGVSTTWDEANELIVDLPSRFSLDSRTEADVLAGANAAAIGAHGRWEIVQFRDAEEFIPLRWRLTGLLRGRRGTEHAIGGSLAADRFVLLSGPGIGRLPLQNSQIGAPLIYRVVTVNASDATGVNQTFTGAGEALKPFAPVHIEGERDGSNNLTIAWTRRGRFGDTLHGGADVPLSEETEAYEVEIMDGLSVVRTLSSSTPTVLYSAANQTADGLTPGDPVGVRVYQLSAIVGRGQRAEAIV